MVKEEEYAALETAIKSSQAADLPSLVDRSEVFFRQGGLHCDRLKDAMQEKLLEIVKNCTEPQREQIKIPVEELCWIFDLCAPFILKKE